MTLAFDSDYYLRANTDVRDAGVDAETHYNQYGAREGRSPNPYFDEAYYRETNPDIDAAVRSGNITSGYVHYQQWGLGEGRNPSELFNEAYYLSHNRDVASIVASKSMIVVIDGQTFPMNGYMHFLAYGQMEGRAPTSTFSERTYLAANPDVAAAVTNGKFTSGWAHFESHGQFENHRGGVDDSLFATSMAGSGSDALLGLAND